MRISFAANTATFDGISDNLVREGLARELAHAVNVRRREIGCEYTDRITLGSVTEWEELRAAVEQFADYV